MENLGRLSHGWWLIILHGDIWRICVPVVLIQFCLSPSWLFEKKKKQKCTHKKRTQQ